jgi:hypothetical protein
MRIVCLWLLVFRPVRGSREPQRVGGVCTVIDLRVRCSAVRTRLFLDALTDVVGFLAESAVTGQAIVESHCECFFVSCSSCVGGVEVGWM